MTVNVEALISGIGCTYEQLNHAGLIPYKTKPTGYPGDPDLTLDMAREGVHLAFKRDGMQLWCVTLSIQHDTSKSWVFPNELPNPFKSSMSRIWVHETLGNPLRSSPPEVIMKQALGWTDLYELLESHLTMAVQINYDITDRVALIAFLPFSELHW